MAKPAGRLRFWSCSSRIAANGEPWSDHQGISDFRPLPRDEWCRGPSAGDVESFRPELDLLLVPQAGPLPQG